MKKILGPWGILALAVLPMLVGISKLDQTADTRVFISPLSDEFARLTEFENRFGRRSTTYFALSLDEVAMFSDEYRRFIQDFQRELWTIPSALSVIGPGSLSHPYSEDDDLQVVPIIELEREDLFSSAIGKETLRGILVSEEKDWIGVYLELEVPTGQAGAVLEIEDQLNSAVDRVRLKYPSARIHMTGEVGLMSAFAHSASADNENLVPAGLLLMLLLIAVGIPSLRLLVIVLSVLLFCISFALSLQGFFGQPINSATAIVPLIVIVIVTANMMHFMWNLFLATTSWPIDAEKLQQASSLHTRPILFSGLTTAFGFFLLLLAESPPFQELGWVVGTTTIVGTALTIFWVPWAVRSFKKRSRVPKQRGRVLLAFSGNLFLLCRNNIVLLAFALLSVVACLGLLRIDINDNFVEYFSSDNEFRRGADVLQNTLGGPNYLELTVSRADGRAALFEDDFLHSWRAIERWLREQSVVSGLTSVNDGLVELETLLSGVPAEQLLLVYEMGLPVGQELSSRITQDRKDARVTVLLNTSDSVEILRLRDELTSYVASDYQVMSISVGGVSIPTSEMSARNTRDVLLGVSLTAFLISGLLAILYKSKMIFGATLFSIVLPIAIGFGIWGWVFGDVGLATAAVLAVTLGVVVDDVIHIVHRHSSLADDQWQSSETAIVGIMKITAPPIFLTSCVLALGFGVLSFSEFGVNRALGITVSLIIICALFVVFAFTPKILERLGGRRNSKRFLADE